MNRLTEGSIVLYANSKAMHKPEVSIVTEVYDKTSGYVALRNLVDLQLYATTYSENTTIPNSWHWPKNRQVQVGDIVRFVDEIPGDYNDHMHLPALVQHVYTLGAEKGRVHLHVFEAFPQDNNAVDAYYSETEEPGTWY